MRCCGTVARVGFQHMVLHTITPLVIGYSVLIGVGLHQDLVCGCPAIGPRAHATATNERIRRRIAAAKYRGLPQGMVQPCHHVGQRHIPDNMLEMRSISRVRTHSLFILHTLRSFSGVVKIKNRSRRAKKGIGCYRHKRCASIAGTAVPAVGICGCPHAKGLNTAAVSCCATWMRACLRTREPI